jgi:hypothetical protein
VETTDASLDLVDSGLPSQHYEFSSRDDNRIVSILIQRVEVQGLSKFGQTYIAQASVFLNTYVVIAVSTSGWFNKQTTISAFGSDVDCKIFELKEDINGCDVRDKKQLLEVIDDIDWSDAIPVLYKTIND